MEQRLTPQEARAALDTVDRNRRRVIQEIDRPDVAGRQTTWIVIAGLVGLAGVTIAVAPAMAADGAGHAVTIASVFVALLVLLGGPPAGERVDRSPADLTRAG